MQDSGIPQEVREMFAKLIVFDEIKTNYQDVLHKARAYLK